MSKLEIVRSGFGHLGVYPNDLRIAGEKPWGGGQTIHSFAIRVDDERVRDAFLALWPEVAAERERLRAAFASVRAEASAAADHPGRKHESGALTMAAAASAVQALDRIVLLCDGEADS